MSAAGKHAEFGDAGNPFSAATFRKALKGFEFGGLAYSEVQIELKRLLAGVSRRDLREVLRRSKSMEPLPEYAYREVRRLLDETIEQDATSQSESGEVREQEEELDPAALTAELQKSHEALESERTRVREAEEALSERILAEEAVRSRLGITLRESESHQAELRAARNSIASRDKVMAQIRQTLDERDAQLAAMRREHAELSVALDLHSASGEQLDADLQVLRGQAADAAAELSASRDMVDQERRKRQEVERALTESNSLNSAARASSASKDRDLAEMRQTLDERDAQLAAMRREHATALQASEEKLRAAQGRVVGANTDLDGLRAQVAQLQARLRDNDALIEELRASARSEAERTAQRPRAQAAQAPAALAKLRSIRMAPRPIWIGAAIVLLATVIWFAGHRPSPMSSRPAVSSAPMIQPATTVPAAESVEPESASTENVSAIEAPPHGGATPAAVRPVTAAAKLKTDFRSCRAGGIDACYDAIRYRPSDPSLLSALGDALLRANRPADALRAYQRVAILAPNMPGVVAKISALEAKLSAKRASGGGSTHAADAVRNSNAAAQTQSH
jgi:chromosome segregation ATPase